MKKTGSGELQDGKAADGTPTARKERLAAALRANLRKRKDQARARKAGGGPGGGPTHGPAGECDPDPA